MFGIFWRKKVETKEQRQDGMERKEKGRRNHYKYLVRSSLKNSGQAACVDCMLEEPCVSKNYGRDQDMISAFEKESFF